jgi:Zn-dependent membrane protease YugP
MTLSFFYFIPPGVSPWYFVLMILGVLITIAAQMRVSAAFRKYQQVGTRGGISGAEVARMILAARGIQDVRVEPTRSFMGDHYDPRDKTLRLSEANYHGKSVAAVGVAAHEVGHAIQHADAYAWLNFRSAMVPVVGIGSRLAGPLITIGILMMFVKGGLAVPILTAAAVGLGAVVVFSLVTLPVEIDASSRAVRILGTSGILVGKELDGAREVLRAAAYTYVAACAVAVFELLKVLMLLAAVRRN